jgi:hypothetical protein
MKRGDATKEKRPIAVVEENQRRRGNPYTE